jgi:hypothetical protein
MSSAAARVSMSSDAMRPKLLESDDAGNLMRWIALQRKVREKEKERERERKREEKRRKESVCVCYVFWVVSMCVLHFNQIHVV